jgi:radical SAM-linked protein
MQRLRLEFGRGKELKYLSHLDLLRLWERAIRRAEMPLAYSDGFTPHPRISLAAPLPVGVTASAELADIWLTRWVTPEEAVNHLHRGFPPGIEVHRACTVTLEEDALQARMDHADYDVEVISPYTPGALETNISSFLNLSTFPWKQQRGPVEHAYDLRPQVLSIEVQTGTGNPIQLRMTLTCNNHGSGRPEQVTLALGFPEPPLRIHRSGLILVTCK